MNLLEMDVPAPCPQCGCEYVKVTKWSSPYGGGDLTWCDDCGKLLSVNNYNEEE